MTEALLALVPTYGLWLIGASVMLSCLALPLPSTILVMAAGGFAAAGDLVYWQLVLVAFGSFVIGDQAVYRVARQGGPALVTRIGRRARGASALASAERLVERDRLAGVGMQHAHRPGIGDVEQVHHRRKHFGDGPIRGQDHIDALSVAEHRRAQVRAGDGAHTPPRSASRFITKLTATHPALIKAAISPLARKVMTKLEN